MKDKFDFCKIILIAIGKVNNFIHSKKVEYIEPEDKKERILALVENYRTISTNSYSWFYTYKDIPEKHKKNLLKFDKNLYIGDFVCIIDDSMFNTCKEGLLFMLSGVYEHWGPLSGAHFIKYSDIDTMEVVGKWLRVYLKECSKKYVDISGYDADRLKELLIKVIDIDKLYDTSYTNESETGHTNGIFNIGKRVTYQKGQISGYKRCSREYAIKLKRQADLFFDYYDKQKKGLNQKEKNINWHLLI
ncbi:MAG: hypothetical protein K2N31_03600 [Treponemataceae bacterium]|nr:hypothetical protein [Treponemataceae bacterium]